MEEEIQKAKYFENLDGALKVYKELRRVKNTDIIKSIDPDFFFNLTDYILANSIPISLIEEKINELNSNMAEQLYIIKEFGEHKGNREKLTMYKEQRDILIELLDERNNTDEH